MNLKLKKVWAWIKKCWYVPALAIFILLAIILCPLCATNDNKLFKMFKASKDSYKKEVDAINKAQEEKRKKERRALCKVCRDDEEPVYRTQCRYGCSRRKQEEKN